MSRPVRVALAGPFPPPYGGMASYFATLADAVATMGVECERIPMQPAARTSALGVWRRLAAFVVAAGRILRGDADVVHCISGSLPNLYANALPLLAARAARRPSVLSIVGGDLHPKGRARRRLLRAVLSLPAQVVVCNDELAAGLRVLGLTDERLVVISNGLPPARAAPTAETNGTGDPCALFAARHDPLLLSVSSWHEHYGSMDLLRAFETIHRSRPGLGLVLVTKAEQGDPEFEREARAFIGRNGLSDGVLLVQNVPSMTALLSRANVFVRTPHMEGDSLSVREALAAGVPTVATDVGHRPAGVVRYAPGDADELARAIDEILRRGGRRPPADQLAHEGDGNLAAIVALYRRLAAR